MSSLGRIAREGSGARLSGKLYSEWNRKVRRHDKMEALLRKIVDGLNESSIDWRTDLPKGFEETFDEAEKFLKEEAR